MKTMILRIKQAIVPLAILLIAILVSYWGITHTFYQQDEWQELGLIYAGKITLNVFHDFNLSQLLLGEGRIFSGLLYYFFFRAFPFQTAPLSILALLFHFVNVCLVYFLALRLTKRPLLAFVASLFFAVNAVINQSVIWTGAIATLPATSLVLGAMNSYLTFIESADRRYLYGSFLLFFGSLLFKEIGIFLILLIPILHYIFVKKPNFMTTAKTNMLFVCYGILVVLFRLGTILFSHAQVGAVASAASLPVKVAIRLLLYPLTSFGQLMVPALPMYDFAEKVIYAQYPYVATTALADIMPQTIGTDLITLVITITLLFGIYLMNRKYRYLDSRFLLVACGLLFLSLLPYIVIDRGSSYLDSRYYYIAAIGAGLLIGYLFDGLWRMNLLGKAIAVIGISFLIIGHSIANQADIRGQVSDATDRKAILETVKEHYPKLNSRTVFYFAGNRDFYIPHNQLPFQQGIGYTLMVWYYEKQANLRSYLGEKFLWDIGTEGYRENNGAGFGLYTNLTHLKEAIRQGKFQPNDVIAFYYDADNKRLTETSQAIQAQISQ